MEANSAGGEGRFTSHVRATAVAPRILDAVLVHGARARMTLKQLDDATGASSRAVAHHVSKLTVDRVLIKQGTWRFGPAAGFVLAVAVGTEYVRAGLVDANGALYCEEELDDCLPDQLSQPRAVLLGRIRDVVSDVLARAFGPDASEVLMPDESIPLFGISVALPTTVGRDGRVHGHALGHHTWDVRHPQTLATLIADELGPPWGERLRSRPLVDVVNSGHASVAAVAYDLARKRAVTEDEKLATDTAHGEVVIALNLGGGISAGAMKIGPHKSMYGAQKAIPGEAKMAEFALKQAYSYLIVGSTGFAGAIAHLPVSDGDLQELNGTRRHGLEDLTRDIKCSCGASGHLRSVVGTRGVADRLRRSRYPLDLSQALGPQLEGLLEDPDRRVRRALEDVGGLLGRALASAVLMLDPKQVTLTGFLARPAVLDGILAEVKRWNSLLPHGAAQSTPELTVLKDDKKVRWNTYVEVRGAAILRLRKHLYNDFNTLADPAQRPHLYRAVRASDAPQRRNATRFRRSPAASEARAATKPDA